MGLSPAYRPIPLPAGMATAPLVGVALMRSGDAPIWWPSKTVRRS